ncbi:MAG: imidazole glycerol phosphate synthase subunit HisF [Alphaproteobacteria bacterium]|nr:imidazole glycerol phosphate synthase subunit HisF [Alphaproteobacteria bacterium]
MLRNRLVLSLMMRNDLFVNSRQFELNPVGNMETILQYLHFDAIDELVFLNVTRESPSVDAFANHLRNLGRHCFVPIAAGGAVRTIDDCQKLLKAGADKIVINTAVVEDPAFVEQAAHHFGSQCLVYSMDVKKPRRSDEQQVYTRFGTENTGLTPVEMAIRAENLGIGEIFLTSIDRDGTCQGYDIALVSDVVKAVGVPVIASGGVGEFKHMVEGIRDGGANAVSAANLFHFIGHSLRKAKTYVRENGLNFPDPLWNFQSDHKL